jgi:hypothetical protein
MSEDESANDNVARRTSLHRENIRFYRNMMKKLGWRTTVPDAKNLDTFLGIRTYTDYYNENGIPNDTPYPANHFLLDEGVRDRIKAFLGPHGDALLKAYKIQRGIV